MAIIFFSYSHKDEDLRDQLECHLALLKNQGFIQSWHDRRILAGDEFDNSILDKIESADIILLLISSDFISSTYCYSLEMQKAMERHEAGRARVIPVILRHCLWRNAPFGKLMAVPRDGKPITSWPDRDEAFADVAKEVAKAVEELAGSAASSHNRTITRPTFIQTAKAILDNPRSSNLRLKKDFTEKDRDDFLRATFDYICKYFESSIDAIEERNSDVSGTFERIDSRKMAAILYRGGKKIAECSVRQEGLSRNNGIAFSYEASAMHGSFNELIHVEADHQSLHWKPMGMGWTGGRNDKHLSQEGAAELYWSLFIKNAQ